MEVAGGHKHANSNATVIAGVAGASGGAGDGSGGGSGNNDDEDADSGGGAGCGRGRGRGRGRCGGRLGFRRSRTTKQLNWDDADDSGGPSLTEPVTTALRPRPCRRIEDEDEIAENEDEDTAS